MSTSAKTTVPVDNSKSPSTSISATKTEESIQECEIEEAPLLNERTDDDGIGLGEAFIHLLKGNIGPGMLSLPYAFSKLGQVASPIIFLLVALLTVYNIDLLLQCKFTLRKQEAVGIGSFGEIAGHAVGPRGKRTIEFFLCLAQFCICCVYFSYIADNIHAILSPAWQTYLSVQRLIVLIYPVLLGLSWIPTLHRITPYSFIAATAVMIGTALTLGYAIVHLFGKAGPTPVVEAPVDSSFTLQHLAEFYGTVVYSLEGIGLVLPIERSLKSDCQKGYRRMLLNTMYMIVLLYVILGEVPLVSFQRITDGSITAVIEEYYQNDWPIVLTNLLLIFAVTFTFPLQFYPAIQVVERHYPRWNRKFLRTIICTALMSVAYIVPNVGLLISLFGSMGASVLAIIAPPILHISLHPDQPKSMLLVHRGISILGIFALVAGSTTGIKDIVDSLFK